MAKDFLTMGQILGCHGHGQSLTPYINTCAVQCTSSDIIFKDISRTLKAL